MKFEIEENKVVDAKILKVFCKVGDNFSADLIDEEGKVIYKYDGYVPNFMPGGHYGDYLILDIDIENGNVLNWKTPTEEELLEFIKGNN